MRAEVSKEQIKDFFAKTGEKMDDASTGASGRFPETFSKAEAILKAYSPV